jgi:hypothetical protein
MLRRVKGANYCERAQLACDKAERIFVGEKSLKIILSAKQIKLKQKNQNKETSLKWIFIAFRRKVQ